MIGSLLLLSLLGGPCVLAPDGQVLCQRRFVVRLIANRDELAAKLVDRGGVDLVALGQLADAVEAAQHQLRLVGVEREAQLARREQHVFDVVRQLCHQIEAQKARFALERVDLAQQRRRARFVVRRALERDHQVAEPLGALARQRAELGNEPRAPIAHGNTVSPARRRASMAHSASTSSK